MVDIHSKIDAMREELRKDNINIRSELSAIRAEISVLNEWKKTVKIYTYSIWIAILGFLSKHFYDK